MNNDERLKWVENLAPGAEVAEVYPGIGSVPYKVTVERRTPAGWVIVNGRTYGRDGYERGGRHVIRPWTDEDDWDARERTLRRRVMDVRWDRVPLATLERVVAALDAGEDA